MDEELQERIQVLAEELGQLDEAATARGLSDVALAVQNLHGRLLRVERTLREARIGSFR